MGLQGPRKVINEERRRIEVDYGPIGRSNGNLLVNELARALLEDEVAPVRLSTFASSQSVDQDPVGV